MEQLNRCIAPSFGVRFTAEAGYWISACGQSPLFINAFFCMKMLGSRSFAA
jgi:hypothetical protein